MVHLDRWATEQAFSAEEPEDPALDPGPMVSVRSLKHALRRRRRLWLTMALAGLVLGAALHMVLPSKVTAVSRLYLVEPVSGSPTAAITNDLSLLQTRKVAETAMGKLRLGPNHALISYKGSSQGSSILSISVTAPTAATAVAWNNAVAQAFLQVRAQLGTATTNDEVQALHAEIQSLQGDLQRISNASSSPLPNIDDSQINQPEASDLPGPGKPIFHHQKQPRPRFGVRLTQVTEEGGHQGRTHWFGRRAGPGHQHCDSRRIVVRSGAHSSGRRLGPGCPGGLERGASLVMPRLAGCSSALAIGEAHTGAGIGPHPAGSLSGDRARRRPGVGRGGMR